MLAAIFAVAAIWLTHQVKRSSRYADPSGVLAVLALGLLTVMVVCAWVSFMLHISDLGSYSVPATYSPGTFLDLYMYTFLELLPGIEVLETLNLKAPIEPREIVAGLPLLAFKLFVVWLFFDAFVAW